MNQEQLALTLDIAGLVPLDVGPAGEELGVGGHPGSHDDRGGLQIPLLLVGGHHRIHKCVVFTATRTFLGEKHE